jgi:hypothetical protein
VQPPDEQDPEVRVSHAGASEKVPIQRSDDPCGTEQWEADVKSTELTRKHGAGEATLYDWKARYGGLDVQRFNGTYREEVLDRCDFETLGEVRRMTADWITRYNEV